MNKPRIVIDTNVVISAALFPTSTSRQAFDWTSSNGVLLASVATIEEIDEVLHRPKFDRYLKPEDRSEFLASLIAKSEIIDVVQSVSAARDPTDDKFLELAVNGRTTTIITGDQDLLVLNPFHGVRIVAPSQFIFTPPETMKDSP